MCATSDDLPYLPCEYSSGGHVTIAHQMLALIIRVFRVIIVPWSDKSWWEILGKTFLAYYHIS